MILATLWAFFQKQHLITLFCVARSFEMRTEKLANLSRANPLCGIMSSVNALHKTLLTYIHACIHTYVHTYIQWCYVISSTRKLVDRIFVNLVHKANIRRPNILRTRIFVALLYMAKICWPSVFIALGHSTNGPDLT
jgi:hypothetical protein